MTKAFLNTGLAFCVDVLKLAPKTRKKGRGVDLNPATLTVKAERLDELLRRIDGGITPMDPPEVESYVVTITGILRSWREEAKGVAPAVQAELDTVMERAALMLRLLPTASIGQHT